LTHTVDMHMLKPSFSKRDETQSVYFKAGVINMFTINTRYHGVLKIVTF